MKTLPRPIRPAGSNRRRRPSRGEISALAGSLAPAAEPNRLHLLLALAEGERTVGRLVSLSEPKGFAATSQHLAILRLGGLVEGRRRGRCVVYALTDAGRVLVAMARPLLGDR